MITGSIICGYVHVCQILKKTQRMPDGKFRLFVLSEKEGGREEEKGGPAFKLCDRHGGLLYFNS